MMKLGPSIDTCRLLMPFPSFGHVEDDGTWRLNITGILRLPYAATLSKRMLVRVLGNVMDISDEDFHSESFRRRVTPFVMDGASGHEIECRVGENVWTLRKKTRRNGHFSDWVTFPARDIDSLTRRNQDGSKTLDVRIASARIPELVETSSVQLISRTGFSVISDIDDTIKESAIGDRKELLANTFTRPFRSVPGMAEIYQAWQQQEAVFHYVSSSPWQLLPAILDMFRQNSFPMGSVHLRNFRLRTHVIQRVIRLRRSGKTTAIRMLLRKFRQRKFILVGDSGEKDVDTYRKVGRSFPEQIIGIFIRDLRERPLESERLETCRATFPHAVCQKFSTADELGNLVQQVLVESKHRSV